MRLGFHYHLPAYQKDGNMYISGYLGRVWDSLAQRCDQLVCFCHTPLPHEMPLAQYKLQLPNVVFVDLGPHSSLPMRILSIPRVNRIVSDWRDKLDCMLLRGPTPLLPDIAAACKPLPVAMLLVGDQLAGINDMPQSRARKEAIRLFWIINNHRQLEIAKHSLTFVNSHLLFQQMKKSIPNLVETRTTTLSETDFYEREDTCRQRPFHILYTGRMNRHKGILDSLEAIATLVGQGMDLIFDLVGPEDKADPTLSNLLKRAEELEIPDRVIFHGYKEAGPELFDYYKKSDLYLIASQSSSEGFPRTIWEAMAHSLPVIATSVGSIPDFAGEAAEIIEPKNVNAIANAIRRVLNDPARRQYMIRTGRDLARENTLENRSSEMIAILEDYVEKRKSDAGKTSN